MTFNPDEHMMDLKGRKYLQVMWRLVWFRAEHADWSIVTDLAVQSDGFALFRAEIRDESGRVLSVGHGSETVKDFRDYIEKAETKAVGRALAMLGYGTQFAPELDEGERIVDSPVSKPVELITPEQAADLAALIDEVGRDAGKLCAYFQVDSLEGLTIDQCRKAVQQCEKARG